MPSMKYLKNKLFRTYGNNHDKPVFTLEDLKDNWREVQKEYPIILSTTFSSVSSLHRDTVYDYLIMDEASQVSVETGALALSCAKNAIIVGDTMQLPNVVTEEDKEKLDFIANACLIKAEYDCARMSFLQSVCKVFQRYRRLYYGSIIGAILKSLTSAIRNFMAETLLS